MTTQQQRTHGIVTYRVGHRVVIADQRNGWKSQPLPEYKSNEVIAAILAQRCAKECVK
jgi:hypothetical protein